MTLSDLVAILDAAPQCAEDLRAIEAMTWVRGFEVRFIESSFFGMKQPAWGARVGGCEYGEIYTGVAETAEMIRGARRALEEARWTISHP